MNDLQTFLADSNVQTRPTIQEDFQFLDTVTKLPAGTVFTGTFGDPQIIPVMTRQGYQDHLVTPLKVETAQFTAAGWTADQLNAIARRSIQRTATGRTIFIQVADYTGVVVFTFLLTDREL